MDRSVYVSMTGATQIMRAQEAVSHNLANASTVGFKSELTVFQSVPMPKRCSCSVRCTYPSLPKN